MQDWINPLGQIFLPDPVNRQHPLNHGRLAWWLVVPGLDGGTFWYDLLGKNPGTFVNYDSGTPRLAWSGPVRPGGWGVITTSPNAGTDQYVTTAFNPNFSAGTICWAMRPTQLPAHGGTSNVQHFWGGTAVGFGSQVFSNGTMYVGWEVTAGQRVTLTATQANYTQNVWQWYAFTWGPAGSALYRNGVIIGSLATVPTTGNVGTLALGRYAGAGTGATLDGQLDDISVYSRVLSGVEISEVYTLSRTGYPGVLDRPVPPLRPAAAAPPTVTAWPAAILGHI